MHCMYDVMQRMCFYVVDGHALGEVVRFRILCSTWFTQQEEEVVGGHAILDGSRNDSR